MSQSADAAWHTNTNKSVNSATARNPASEETARSRKINRAVAEFVEAHTDRANVPIATEHGTQVRRAFVEEEREEWVEDQPDEPRFEAVEAVSGSDVVDVTAYDWADAVRAFCEKHAEAEETTINLEFSTPTGPTLDEFSFPAVNRWMASYQEKYYAQLEGWLRELTGGSRPSGGDTAPSFDNPNVALLTRSASSVPGDDRVGPVDHAQALRDAWEPTYHTLRNTMRSLGYELGEDWQYVRRMEPHTSERGGGTNAAYGHEHTIVVVDGEVTADDLRPVVEKHVEACEWASGSAHGDDAVEVRDPDDLTNVAAYVADYCSVEPTELWEREPAYVGWAAAMTAGNVRVMSRSEAAREAAQADACRQRAESPEADQEAGHGEDVRRLADGSVACAECGSAHGIEAETLTAARAGEVAADGGEQPAPQHAYTDEALRSAWPEADAAAAVGEPIEEPARRDRVRRAAGGLPPDASVARIAGEVTMAPDEVRRHLESIEDGRDPSEVRGFDVTVPKWSVESVTVAGEERSASGGNGVEMVAVREWADHLMSGLEEGTRYRCECGVAAYGRSMAGHLRGHGFEEPGRAVEVVVRE